MNKIQKAIFIGSREESGIWEVLTDIVDENGVDRKIAFDLLKNEVDFILHRDDIYLIRSEKIYDSATCKIIDKNTIDDLKLHDVEFNEQGPFFYFSNAPGI